MNSDIRHKSHLIGRFFLGAELMRRGYKVSLENLKKGEEIPVETQSDIPFRIKYSSTVKYGQSWLIGPIEPDDSLFYVLICTEAESPYKPPNYWILTSQSIYDLRAERMPNNEQSDGTDLNIYPNQVVSYAGKWDTLP